MAQLLWETVWRLQEASGSPPDPRSCFWAPNQRGWSGLSGDLRMRIRSSVARDSREAGAV